MYTFVVGYWAQGCWQNDSNCHIYTIQYYIVFAQTVRTVCIELENGAIEITREIQAALLNNVINGAVDQNPAKLTLPQI